MGHPIAKYASLLMAGRSLADVGLTVEPKPDHVAVKEVVLPFRKFAGCDTLLGPEMRSTGEVREVMASWTLLALALSQCNTLTADHVRVDICASGR